MKKIFLIFAGALVLMQYSFKASSYQQTDNSLARVSQTLGKYIFYHNTPSNEYDVAFMFEDTAGLKKISNTDFDKITNIIVANANKESGLQGKIYDAIIVSDGGMRDMAITFKDKSKDNSIARVGRNEGKYVFLFCEPSSSYDVAFKMNSGGFFGSFMSLQDKIDRIMKKADKKNIQYDGVVFGNSSQDLCVKFK